MSGPKDSRCNCHFSVALALMVPVSADEVCMPLLSSLIFRVVSVGGELSARGRARFVVDEIHLGSRAFP